MTQETPSTVPSDEQTNQAEQAIRRTELNQELFAIVFDHLTGVSRDRLQGRLQPLCDDPILGGKSAVKLYSELEIVTDADRANLARLIRFMYPATPNKIIENPPKTLYGYLQRFGQDKCGHRHLEDFNHLLSSVHPKQNPALPLFITTVLTGGLGLYFYLKPEHLVFLEQLAEKYLPYVWEFLYKTFSVLKNIPLLLMLYNIITIPIQTIYACFDTFRSPMRRLQRWAVATLPSIANLIAYSLVYLSGGVFTPLSAAFFIGSSFVEVFNSLFSLLAIGHMPEDQPGQPLEQTLDNIRKKERIKRTLKTILVNFLASAAIAVTVTFWCIFPPSFLMMIGYIVLINLVNFTRSATLNMIHTEDAKSLQLALEKAVLKDKIESASELSEQEAEVLSDTPVPERPRLKRSHSCSSMPTLGRFSMFQEQNEEPLEPEISDNDEQPLAQTPLRYVL